MYEISNQIAEQEYKKLQVKKLVKTTSYEILSISLEKDSVFPEHTSPTDAQLVVLDGDIVFHINCESYSLKKHEYFNFPKEEKHWVRANANSKFLIIR